MGAALMLDRNTLPRLLTGLVAAGWVTRRRYTGDERQVRLRLTEAGRDLGTAAGLVPACFLDKTGMGREEAAVLRDAVMALRDRLRPR